MDLPDFCPFFCGDSMVQNDQATAWMHVTEPKMGGFLWVWALSEACGAVNVWHAFVTKDKATHKHVACETQPRTLENQTSPTSKLAINNGFQVATEPN